MHGTVKPNGDERSSDSLEVESISKEIRNFVGVIDDSLKEEELKKRLAVIADKVASLEKKSRTDALTGLLNRGGFDEEAQLLGAIFAREKKSDRAGIPSTLLMIDIDNFKNVNDTCGHSAGDKCLQVIAKHVKGILRESDIFARIGGDEFAIFLSGNDEIGAKNVAAKVRSIIEDSVVDAIRKEFPNYEGGLSTSIGVVALDSVEENNGGEHLPIEEIMKLADYASYVAKAAGKRRELTLEEAQEIDADGQIRRNFLVGKTLSRQRGEI